MSSCLSCVPSKPSSRPPAGCRTCTTKAELRGGGCNADITGSEPFTLLQPPCLSSFSICVAVSPPLLLGGDQVIKHRLQRLLRPQKEERRSRPQTSTVATVGLEEMKSKVRSKLQQLRGSHARLSCTALMHGSQRGNRESV